ncbi:MAG: cytochrome c [Polyangiaceae bacterium]|nr:cytochrome c [Polyangiaceae bacterium]
MIHQARYSVWQESPLFADGKVMRSPPAGTVPIDAIVGDPALTEGVAGGNYVTRIPVPVTPGLLQAGRERFDILCAPCHGVTGDGDSQVARNMALRKPPDLTAPPVTEFPAGRIHEVISRGYGLMRSYHEDMPSPVDRWAVVAYVRALQRSRNVPLASLPPDLRARAAEALR